MNVSQISGPSPSLPVKNRVDNNGYPIIDLATTLTDDDKRIVKAATGYNIGEETKVNALAVSIAISRFNGDLKGPVTESFLQNVAQNPQITASVISKAIESLKNPHDPKTHKSEVSLFA